MEIQAFKKRFDPVLEQLLLQILGSYQGLTKDAFILEMVDYSRVMLLSGGKRVRPYMAWLAYKASGGKKDAQALDVFTGLELFHAFALVHDDIMDHGTERHGVKTAHRYVQDRLRALKRHGDAHHLGEAQAILIGDLLFAWATNQVAGTKAWDAFRLMIDEVMVGQMIDVDVMTRRAVDDQLLDDKMRLKTSSYTFVRPMQMGAELAGANGKMKRFCEAYGLPLGTAFQIQDDLLDLITPSKDSGKTALSDLREGNHTIFTQFVRMRGTKAQKRELESMVGSALKEKDRARVVALFTEAGAIDHGRALIEGYFEAAFEAVERAGLKSVHADSFRALIDFIRARAK
jgi:geranylgeranyl diphosphate synthase type I